MAETPDQKTASNKANYNQQRIARLDLNHTHGEVTVMIPITDSTCNQATGTTCTRVYPIL
eukprot:m.103613 g.103613  ORF g.103613 m.103613 type:complete len:60 (+) comp13244_c0_seq10:2264-2443(+)